MKEKELSILHGISNLRFMNTSQIHKLYGYSGRYGDIVTRRKLRELESQGYLKSWQPSKYEQKIFYISRKGAEEVRLFYGLDKVHTVKKSGTTPHQVMITEIYVALRLEKRGRLRRFQLNTGVGEAVSDAFVQFDIGDKSKLFFLEADRATESIPYIRDEKLKGYKRGFSSNMYKKQFNIFPDVIFITISDTRKRSLLNLASQFPFKIRVFTMDEFQSNPMIIT